MVIVPIVTSPPPLDVGGVVPWAWMGIVWGGGLGLCARRAVITPDRFPVGDIAPPGPVRILDVLSSERVHGVRERGEGCNDADRASAVVVSRPTHACGGACGWGRGGRARPAGAPMVMMV